MHVDVVKTTCWSSKPSIRENLDFELGLVACAGLDGLVWGFHKLPIYWDLPARLSMEFSENGNKNIQWAAVFFWWKYLVDVRGQRRTGRLQDRKATGTEISSHHNRAMQQHDKLWSRWAKASPKHNTRTRKNISALDKLLSVVGASLTSQEFLKVQFEKFGLISDF